MDEVTKEEADEEVKSEMEKEIVSENVQPNTTPPVSQNISTWQIPQITQAPKVFQSFQTLQNCPPCPPAQQTPVKDDICPKCHGTGMVKEGNGAIHTCWDCMQNGKLNQHSEALPDNSARYKI